MTASIHYLRKGRKLRATGTVIWRDKGGLYKVKPALEDWGCVIVTPEEIEAGKEKPAYQPREKREEGATPKRTRKLKPDPKRAAELHRLASDALGALRRLNDFLENAETLATADENPSDQ